MNSRNKGKRGELEFVHFLKERGIEAKRSQQYQGSADSADVDAGVPVKDIHWEVKRREAGNPYDWVDQAKRDTLLGSEFKRGRIPVVAHKRNGREWIAILPMEDFITIMRKANAPDIK